jgi:hypothetical protein
MAVASRWPCVICALLVAGVGISVDDRDSQKENIKSDSQRAEFEIVGTYETVLKNNMDQLQWTTLSMLLLSLSTALLGVAQEVPAQLTVHPSVLAIADGSVQDWLAFGVDLSEQVCLRHVCAVSLVSLQMVGSRDHFIFLLMVTVGDMICCC